MKRAPDTTDAEWEKQMEERKRIAEERMAQEDAARAERRKAA